MTIAIAWTKRAAGLHELVVASDSRLTSAGHIDVCQKIFPLARGDSFLAFCGDTMFAFPLIFQVQFALQNFEPSIDRSEDISRLETRVLDIINSFRGAWRDYDLDAFESDVKKTRFLLGGWSWKRNRFLTSAIRYNSKKNEFAAYRPTKTIKRLNLADGEFCVAIGNYTAEFIERLVDAIAEKNLRSLNYEPLDILVEMLRTDKFTNRRSEEALYSRSDKAGAIGGAPQAIKIYQHANVRTLAVRWPVNSAKKTVTLFGRPLLEYERTTLPIYDCDEKRFFYPLSDIRNSDE
jgi:hypothetical protein